MKNKAVIVRNQPAFSRDRISANAILVLEQLNRAGFQAYIVGGAVRDLYLGIVPKDFDIATNALPQEIRKVFKNCRLIGRRFRLAHIYFKREIIEVATFRGAIEEQADSGVIIKDNIYGTIEEDVWRRDFTINALFYDIKESALIDYTGAVSDLENRLVRIIGEPKFRYLEDPVRMLRGVRLAAKLDFTLDAASTQYILQHGELLNIVSAARLFDEILKWFLSGSSQKITKLFIHYDLFAILFPQVRKYLQNQEAMSFIETACRNTDVRIKNQKTINPAFLFAVLLWHPFQDQLNKHLKSKMHLSLALTRAADEIFRRQRTRSSMPYRFTSTIKIIWILQYRFNERSKKKVYRTLNQPRFRAAYDFLLLRAETDPSLNETATWWTKVQEKALKIED